MKWIITAIMLLNVQFGFCGWNDLHDQSEIKNRDEQAYCYIGSDGRIHGANHDIRIRLASVSKLFTTLWAVDKLGANYQYETKLFVKGKHLHIEGANDPFFGRQKMFFLLSELRRNNLKIKTISFSNKFLVYDGKRHSNYKSPTHESTRQKLTIYFRPKKWSRDFIKEYERHIALAKSSTRNYDDPIKLLSYRKLKKFNIKLNKISTNQNFPFDRDDDDIRVFVIKSPILTKYLKVMNVKSDNYIADTLFSQLGKENGGAVEFSNYLQEEFDISKRQVTLYNGSGLDSKIDGKRVDNYATCGTSLRVIEALKNKIEDQGYNITDVVAVPGSDGGTFKDRLNSKSLKNTFVAKTGTLFHTYSLAGVFNTAEGERVFGIYHQTQQKWSARKIQNEMVVALFDAFGGTKKFDYQKKSFYPAIGPIVQLN